METNKKGNKKYKKEKFSKHWRWQSKVVLALGCFAFAISSLQIAY